MDYTNPARFEVDATVHAFGAITRGIENGYTIVRAARNGYLGVYSPTGERIAQTLSVGKKYHTLIADVPIWINSSRYTKYKDCFIGVLIVILFLFIVKSVPYEKNKRKKRHSKHL